MEHPTRLGIEPEYTMQTVEERTGVPPNTIRSWERRHQILAPARGSQGERLYSERDVRLITWIRDQRALQRPWKEIVDAVRFFDFDSPQSIQTAPDQPPSSSAVLAASWPADFDDAPISATLNQALTVRGGLEAAFQVLLPAYRELVNCFDAGELRATEFSYGGSWLRQRLLSILTGYQDRQAGSAIITSPIKQGEDIALIAHAIDLARHGKDIIRFDLPLLASELVRLAKDQDVKAIILCAESEETAWRAMEYVRVLAREVPDISIGLCGAIFTNNSFPGSVKPAIVLPDIRDAWKRIPGLEND